MPRRSINNRLDFLSPVSLVPGLGPRRIAALRESGIETIRDLLYHFPRRYIDRSVIVPISRLNTHVGQTCCVIGVVTRTRVERGRNMRFRIQVTDDSGSFEALWFHGIPFLRTSIRTGQRYLFTGAVSHYGVVQMVHPVIEQLGASGGAPDIAYLPQYPLTEAMREAGFGQKGLLRAIRWIIDNLKHYPQVLPQHIERKKGFPTLQECLRRLHLPENPADRERYAARLRYEELYQLALTLRWSRRKFALPGRPMKPGTMAETLKAALPFRLTEDQEAAIRKLYDDAAADRRMHRLLHGDVGSGKTIVALFACLPALNEGLQVAWMAPTEVLASQTARRISAWLSPLGIKVQEFRGGISASDRQQVLRDLGSGVCRFVVGTHALLQPGVRFARLGMIVIDEQHKFGAEQRLRLAEKDAASDFLLMSATPIPQTLAKTLYGDLDITTIRSLPEGRQPVSTHIVPEAKRADMEQYIAGQIGREGKQAYYLVPRIESCDEGEKMRDINDVFASLERGPLASTPKAMIHGRMKSEEKDEVMRKFGRGEVKLLIATTLIEVGIDVEAATLMVIENAERFGLSQLHQLRGRVGRGKKQGYCFLMTGQQIDEDCRRRLESFCMMHDGFAIAELDLRLRGPGDVVGYRQTGWEDLKAADIVRDADLFKEIQEEVDRLLER